MTTNYQHDSGTNNGVVDSYPPDDSGIQPLSYTTRHNKPNTTGNNVIHHREFGSPDEKKQFIPTYSDVVKLDPGLESVTKSRELYNTGQQELDQPPTDRYKIVFGIFLIHGVGILMPWNMFITAKSYFEDYKLNTPTSKDAVYRSEFMFYLGIVSQVSSAVVSCGNTFFQFGGKASTTRVAIALFSMVMIFIFTVILAMVDTSGIPLIFFGLTLASASLLNCCCGVYQNIIFGMAAILPMKYTNAIVLGSNLSGVFTSVINILSIAVREEYDESGSFGLKSEASLALPGDSQANTQLMDVLKSLSISEQGERPFPELSYRSSKLNSTKEPRSINNETFTLQNVHSPKEVDIPKPVCLLKKNIPIGERKLLGLDSVKAMVNLRFQTWGLNGYWRIDDDSIEMFSKSQEEASHCMQLLKETLLEKTIPLRKDSKFIVESDKWQIMTGMLRKRHQEQVQIDVNHANCEVTVYSTSMFILKDSCDIIRFFLRDNQMKTVTLRYDEPLLAFIMKHKRILKRICQSLSQYCLDISTVDKTNMLLRGIGFGVGRAMQMVNSLASKYAKSTDEDQFDSDSDTDEDEEERFAEDADEAQAVEASNVTVQINLALEDDTEAAVSALCFPGDDRLLYVVAGNMIELPVKALVNAADKTLKHNGGLAKALVLKGGRSIQEECTFYVQNNGNVEIGQVFCSDAGTLQSSVIMHAVGPKWIDGNHEEKDKLFECVTNCLRSASKRKIASVAFPAISAGTYRFPIKEATLTIMNAVKDFLQHEPRCSIREIYFCDRDMDTASEFVVSMKGTFHGDDIILSGGQVLPKSAESVETGRNDKRQILFF